MVQHTKTETFYRKFATVFNVVMKRVSNSPADDEITIVSGVGKNSPNYDAPYNESQSGKIIILKG